MIKKPIETSQFFRISIFSKIEKESPLLAKKINDGKSVTKMVAKTVGKFKPNKKALPKIARMLTIVPIIIAIMSRIDGNESLANSKMAQPVNNEAIK